MIDSILIYSSVVLVLALPFIVGWVFYRLISITINPVEWAHPFYGEVAIAIGVCSWVIAIANFTIYGYSDSNFLLVAGLVLGYLSIQAGLRVSRLTSLQDIFSRNRYWAIIGCCLFSCFTVLILIAIIHFVDTNTLIGYWHILLSISALYLFTLKAYSLFKITQLPAECFEFTYRVIRMPALKMYVTEFNSKEKFIMDDCLTWTHDLLRAWDDLCGSAETSMNNLQKNKRYFFRMKIEEDETRTEEYISASMLTDNELLASELGVTREIKSGYYLCVSYRGYLDEIFSVIAKTKSMLIKTDYNVSGESPYIECVNFDKHIVENEEPEFTLYFKCV